MKCHYEVLGVQMRASDDDLKKAYRKMALQWHPDKNPDNLVEAKQQFQLIQAAYEILSDPQERAFYDRNRDSILRGKDTESSRNPGTLDLFQYFTTQCYSGFNDSEKGFYTVYRGVFEKIAAMDMKYMSDEEEEIIIPNFGCSTTDHEDVGQFYGYWTSYCSAMDFRWADEYDIREAHGMGRWVERKVEKDNSKARQKARKQFNEHVRELVNFVRKRDKRWQVRKRMMEMKVEENARKREDLQQRQWEEREHRMKDDLEKERAKVAEYQKELEMLEDKFAEEWGLTESEDSNYLEEEKEEEEAREVWQEEGDGDQEEDLLVLEDLYCVACNKNFRTEKSLENHQRSKKHKENLEVLKAKMTAEDFMLLNQSVGVESFSTNDLPPQEKSSKKKKKKKNKNNTLPEDPHEPSLDSTDDSTEKKKKNQKQIYVKINTLHSEKESEMENESGKEEEGACDSAQTSLKCDGPNLEVNEREKVPSDEGDHVADSRDKTDKAKAKPNTKGKKVKDVRKKAQEGSQATDNEVKLNRCTVCGKDYPSRTKLFSHIKAEGHAALKTIGERETKSRNKGKHK